MITMKLLPGSFMKKLLSFISVLCSLSKLIYGQLIWTDPTTISTPLIDASEPCVVIDSNGNATAAWIENNTIKASSLLFGGSWSLPITLSNVLNTSIDPKLKVDASGNVTALWIENTVITSATLPFGGSWSSSTSISSSGSSNAALAVDSFGNAVAVWVRDGFIESSTRISGIWSTVKILSGTNSSNPDVAISDFGRAIAAWHRVVSGSDVIVTDMLTINTNTWAATKNVFSGTASFFHNYPKIAIDSSGNANVAWFRYNFLNNVAFQNVHVLTSTLTFGAGAWSIPSILSNAGIRNPADLKIVLHFDASDNALAIWTNSYDGETFSIESAKKPFGLDWSLFVIPTIPTLYSFALDTDITSGTAILTDMAFNGISSTVIKSQLTDTTNPLSPWWTPEVVISNSGNNGYPQCAISQIGNTFHMVAVWINFDGTNNVIHASTGTDSEVESPSNVSASQSVIDYGIYQDYCNAITWDASPASDIMQYNLYRNGVFFSSTDPSILQYVDHNAIQDGTVTYGVAAFTSTYQQSSIINFTLNP